jgi:hypothetical protein
MRSVLPAKTPVPADCLPSLCCRAAASPALPTLRPCKRSGGVKMTAFFTSTSLPPGWRVKSDPDGKIYYENAKTGETSWTWPVSSTNRRNGQNTPLPQQPLANPYLPTFNNVGGARVPSIGSAIKSSFMQDFNKGFT